MKFIGGFLALQAVAWVCIGIYLGTKGCTVP